MQKVILPMQFDRIPMVASTFAILLPCCFNTERGMTVKIHRPYSHVAALLLSVCCTVFLGSCGSGAVGAPDPSAGATLTVSPAVAELFPGVATTFTIAGGRSGYTAFSSNNTALPIAATVTGSTFTVTANSVNADTVVDITVRDAANASTTAKATIKAGAALAVSPSTAVLFADLPTTFTVTGGRPGYTAFSSNSAILPVTTTITGTTFSVVPNAVSADTAVDITVRDTANTAVTAKATVKPSALLNQITFTPFAPTATGCGANALCSGGDAQVVVTAVQNGVILRNRAIRCDVFQGAFQLVTPATGTLVNSLVINTDQQGEAVVRITANSGTTTQVATIQTTDVTSGLARRYNFNIVQQISGVGILSTLPSGAITITGAKGTPGADGSCPFGATVDNYVFGGSPPYAVRSPLPGVATVSPATVGGTGGKFTATVTGCGKLAFIVTDASGRTVETSAFEAVQGAKGDATTSATSITVSPSTVTLICGNSTSVSVTGSGNFAANVTTGTGGAGFSISPSAGPITTSPVSLTASSGPITSPVIVNFSNGSASPATVTVTVTGIVAGSCP